MTTLFHYCSTATFFNIVKNRSIWLSSLSASNDTQEGKWLSRVMHNVARESGLDQYHVLDLLSRFRRLEDGMDCLGLCLSEDGDMLSQWRGYANDATGISIGIKADVFQKISVAEQRENPAWVPRLQKIAYEEKEQSVLLAPRLERILELVNAGVQPLTILGYDPSGKDTFEQASQKRRRNDLELTSEILNLVDLLYATKNPAFREEREWRFVRDVIRTYNEVEFRVRGDTLVAYQELKLPDASNVFDEVYIGPRNATPVAVIDGFLKRYGLVCAVRTSSATYR